MPNTKMLISQKLKGVVESPFMINIKHIFPNLSIYYFYKILQKVMFSKNNYEIIFKAIYHVVTALACLGNNNNDTRVFLTINSAVLLF